MEALKIAEKSNNVLWNYDPEADVLYVSIGKQQKAIGIGTDEGTIIHNKS